MDATTKLQPLLPDDVTITERSRAFYDGRYKWDSDGFTDDHGVYREFDCYVPEARAPTPLPPTFSDDYHDNTQEEDVVEIQAQTLNIGGALTSMDGDVLEPDTPYPRPDSITAGAPDNRTTEGTKLYTAPTINSRERNIKVPQDRLSAISPSEFVASYQDESTIVGKLESIVNHAETEPSLNELHKLPTQPFSEKEEVGDVKMPDTPPESPTKPTDEAQAASPVSTTSTLSSAPSNLTDQDHDMGVEIEGASMHPQSDANMSDTPLKSSPLPKAKAKPRATTRGVARKVTKGGKKTGGSKSSPLKRKDESVEDFTLLQLHSGEFLRKSGRRKSARLTQSEGD
ncbi:hypothetical protein N0V95_006975 [Ascochyta clinopodiicola]|nr:hypothetical protein N0V95_006975 [Ascochyta clinopodiicola]